MAVRIALVAAMAKNQVIGKDGALPWYLPDDLKHFKSVTMGHPVVMGRKTFESLSRPLPGRENIIVTRNTNFHAEGAHVEATVDAALQKAEELAQAADKDWIMVIGGGEIYRQTIERADRLYLTEIDAEYEGDTTFPEYKRRLFKHAGKKKNEKKKKTYKWFGAPICHLSTLDRIRPKRP